METRHKIGIVLLVAIFSFAFAQMKIFDVHTLAAGTKTINIPALYIIVGLAGFLMVVLRKGFFKKLFGLVLLLLAVAIWAGWKGPDKTDVKKIGTAIKKTWEMDVPESVKEVIRARTTAPDSTISNYRAFSDSMMLVVDKEIEYANKQFAVHFRSSQIPPNLKNVWVYFVDTTQVVAGTDTLGKPIVVVDTVLARVELQPTANGDKTVWSGKITERGRLFIFLWFEGKSPMARPYYVDVAWRDAVR